MTQRVTTNKDEWLRARQALLEKENAWSRHGDELAAIHCDLPKLKLTESDAAYSLIEMTPHGRQEGDLPFPLACVRRREDY